MTKESKPARGAWAEQEASQYLERKGLTMMARNYRCKVGEIDLIMRDGEQLVFVEVRQRNNRFFGSAIETVDPRKQKKLVRAARHYLQISGLTEKVACRFDVVGIETQCSEAAPAEPEMRSGAAELTWVRDAFRLG